MAARCPYPLRGFMHLSGHTHRFSSQLSGDVIHEQLHTELVRPRGAQVEAGQEEDVPVRV